MPEAFLNQLARRDERGQDPFITTGAPLARGVINRFGPQYIPEDAASSLANIDLADPTRPRIRDGYVEIVSAQNGITNNLTASRPSGLVYYSPGATGTLPQAVLTIPDQTFGAIYRTADTTSAWVEVKLAGSSYNVGNDYTPMFQAGDALVIIPEPAKNVVAMDASGNLTDGGDTNNSPPRGCVDGCSLYNRAWLLKPGSPVELHFSKLLPTAALINTIWDRGQSGATALAGRLQLSPNWRAEAVAVKPWNSSSLIVFFDSCVEEIQVNPADPGLSTRRVIEPRFGCSSPQSIVVVGQELFFQDQYGEYRSLTQTINAAQAGVTAEPLSEAIAADVGRDGRINKAALDKSKAVIFGKFLELFYATGTKAQADTYYSYDLLRKSWCGPNALARPVSAVMVSNIRSSGDFGEEMFFADGGDGTVWDEQARVYRMFPGTYTDNGTSYAMSMITRAYDSGAPESDKLPEVLEIVLLGTQGVTVRVDVQVGEDGIFQQLGDVTIPVTGQSSWPLVFPLVFPLIAASDGLYRAQLYFGDVSNFGRGRQHRFRFSSTPGANKTVRIAEWRFIAHVEPCEFF